MSVANALGVDLSNWDAGQNDYECFRRTIGWAIVGCQVESVGLDMGRSLISAGTPVPATYAFLYFGYDGFMGFQDLISLETNKAIRVAKQLGCRWVALDVEASGANERASVTVNERVADLDKAIGLVEAAGLKPIIYTGKYYWQAQMGNVDRSMYPLWHASYWPDHYKQYFVDYGHWVSCAIHQWVSNLPLCGRPVRDQNWLWDLKFFDISTEDQQTGEEIVDIQQVVNSPEFSDAILELVAQILGAKESTYSEALSQAKVELVRNKLSLTGRTVKLTQLT